MTILVDAQYLSKQEIVRGGAAEIFFKHRDEVIFEKIKENPDYDFIPRESFARSRLEFPSFHRNWIDGILTACLRALNHVAAVSADYINPVVESPQPKPGPIHDPFFVFKIISESESAALATPAEPALDLAGIVPYFALPGEEGLVKAGTDCGAVNVNSPPNVDNGRGEAFKAGAKNLTATKYKRRIAKDYLPNIASDEFPDLEYPEGDTKGLSLRNKQELLIDAIIEAYDELVNTVLEKPSNYLFPIALGTVAGVEPKPNVGQQQPGLALNPIFEAAKEILDEAMPDPSANADDAISNIVNYEALKRTLVKPLYLATIGVLFGSHQKGFTGLMSKITPDPVGSLNLNFADPKPENLDLDMRGSITEGADLSVLSVLPPPDPQDANRNGVPIKRNILYVPKRYHNVGTGYKNSVYLRLRDMGSKFISSNEVNSFADDNHKGLMFLFALSHETGFDLGVGVAGLNAQTKKWDTAGPGAKLSDSFVWGMSIGAVGTTVSSVTANEFQSAPVYNPNGNPTERGIPIDRQLDFYEEWLCRNLLMIGARLPVPPKNIPPKNMNEPQNSPLQYAPGGGREHPSGKYYGGPEPFVANNLATVLKPKWTKAVSTSGTFSTGFVPKSVGGVGSQRDPGYEDYKAPYYYMNTPYDIYGFHQGIFGSGDRIAQGGTNPNTYAEKHVVFYTMPSRGMTMVSQGEHVPRYMAACGMKEINFDMLAIAGLRRYMTPQGGSKLASAGAFPQGPQWLSENGADINIHQKLHSARDAKNK